MNETKDKIKTPEEIARMKASLPHPIILCHGCYDLIHSGHFAQFEEAKKLGGTLIVSITGDEFIEKGNLDRPFYVEETRAKHLAKLPEIDFVVIDRHVTPIDIITQLQPEIFVKGAEYQRAAFESGTKTNEELTTVRQYGGEMRFISGNFIDSSTRIRQETPVEDSRLENLAMLFKRKELTETGLLGLIEDFGGKEITIIGDTIVDRLTYCQVQGTTGKGPTLSVVINKSQDFVGAAGVVASNFAALGAKVNFITVLGDDKAAAYVEDTLMSRGVSLYAAKDRTRPTTIKERFIVGGANVLQASRVENDFVGTDTTNYLLRNLNSLLSKNNTHALVFSDFRHGLLSPTVIQGAIDLGKKNKTYLVADTQVSSRWGDLMMYKGVNLALANMREAQYALHDQDSGPMPVGRKIMETLGLNGFVLKLGRDGAIAFEPSRMEGRGAAWYPIPPLVGQEYVVDPIGAGDAMLAVTTLTYEGKDILAPAFLGACAASTCIKKAGNIPVDREELKEFVSSRYKQIMRRA